ncbi:MAG TPA: DUF1572 family protein [Vicinamibacterales bacterium]|nr:DUF1572 family protein [Vicinamibacterales bacterium]
MREYLVDVVRTLKHYKALGEGALAQVDDADLHVLIDPDANSLAIIVKHVAGNLRSRFADFLTTDGEKPERNRDGEFEMPDRASRAQILVMWNEGWSVALAAIEALTPADLDRTIHIRREPFLVPEALNRSAAHTAYHVGQIVFLAKHFAGSKWKSLSIPKNQSRNYSQGTFRQGIVPPKAT